MDSHCILILPKSQEEALFALPVVNHYMMQRRITGRPSENLIVVTELEELTPLIKAGWKFAKVQRELSEQDKAEADIIFEFSTERAYQMTHILQNHITDAFSLQVGVSVLKKLPAVLVETCGKEVLSSVLYISRNAKDELRDWAWPYLDKFVAIAQENNISVSCLYPDATLEEMRAAIARASVVVGVRGTGTLLAAAAHKIVMELSPDTHEHRHWMPKWEDGKYRMIYGPLKNMTAEFVWQRTRLLAEDVHQKRKAAEHLALVKEHA